MKHHECGWRQTILWKVALGLGCGSWLALGIALDAATPRPTLAGQDGQIHPLPPIRLADLIASDPHAATSQDGRPSRARPPRHLERSQFRPEVPESVRGKPEQPPAWGRQNPIQVAETTSGEELSPNLVQAAQAESGGGGPLPSPPPAESFAALGDDGTQYNPDTAGAVGPNHLMVALSSEIRIQNRQGGVISTVSLNSFWASAGSPEVFDPRVLYDPYGQRWIHTAAANFDVNPGLLVAVSQTSDPTGQWNRYFLDLDTQAPLYAVSPNVGFNKNWITLASPVFFNTNNFFAGHDIFVLNKTNLYTGSAAAFTRFSFLDPFSPDPAVGFGDAINTPVPAATYDPNVETLYLVGQWNNNSGGFGYLRLHKITSVSGTIVFNADQHGNPGVYPQVPFAWEVAMPNDADVLPQSGTTRKIAAGDARIQNVVFCNGTVWAAHTVFLPAEDPDHVGVQWWEILPNTGNAFQAGLIEDPTAANMFAYPSIAANANSDALLGFSSFAINKFPSASYAMRLDTDNLGLLRSLHTYKLGEAKYDAPDPNNGNKNFWGDWSATVVDPVNDLDLWTLQEYGAPPINSIDRWGTWWAKIGPPVNLTATISDSPDPVLAGQNITYTITVRNNETNRLATGARLVNTLPPQLAYVTATSSRGSCAHNAGVITCNLGDLPASAVANITIQVLATDSGDIVNTVVASGSGPDVNPADNTVSTTTTVNPSSDLSVSAVANPAAVNVGDTVQYSVTVTNRGPTVSSLARMTNTFPAGITMVSFMTSQGSCSYSSGTLTCTFGTVAKQGSIAVTVNIIPTSPSQQLNTIFGVSASTFDPAIANNTAPISIRANAYPVLQSLSNRTIQEDEVSGPRNFTISDAETSSANLMVQATSSNPALVPNENIVLGGTGGTRTITVTPLPNQFGSTIITRFLTDADGASVNSRFTLTVNSVNDRPTISNISDQTVSEDTSTATLAFTIGDVETALESLSVSVVASNTTLTPANQIFLGGSGANRTIRVLPGTNQFGSGTITITVGDGALTTNRVFTLGVLPVNDRPVLSAIANQTTPEDSPTSSINLTVSDVETAASNLSLTAASTNPALISSNNVVFSGTTQNRGMVITPAAHQFGNATVMVVLRDSDGGTTTNTFLMTVTGVNDPPFMNPVSSQSYDEDSGPRTINLTGISAGPGNESQPIQISAISSLPSLIPNPGVVYMSPGATGQLTLQPLTNAHGTATITVTLNDGDSTNATFATGFDITIQPVNDPPTVSTVANQTINEDTLAGPYSFTVADVDSVLANLDVMAISSDLNLVPANAMTLGGAGANRQISLLPATNQNGQVTITLRAEDGQASGQSTFNLTIQAVNDAPTLTPPANLQVAEDTSTGPISFMAMDVESSLGQLMFSATSSNLTLIPEANIQFGSSNGQPTLMLSPADNQSGSTTLSLRVTDPQGGSATGMVQVTVQPVNDPPTLDSIGNLTRNEDSGPWTVNLSGIGSGAPNENQSLAVRARSSRLDLLPDPAVTYSSPGASGTLTLQPLTNANGMVTITVEVDDQVASNNIVSRAFELLISPINDLPVISPITDRQIDEDTSTGAIGFTVWDVETPADQLTLQGSSSNEELVFTDDIVFGLAGTNRSVTVQPLPEQFGAALIIVQVTDGNGASAMSQFLLTVNAVNDPPTIQPVADQSMLEDTASSTIAILISDPETPAGSLSLSASSSDTTLVPASGFQLGGSGGNRNLVIRSGTNQFGSATVTMRAGDGNKTNTMTFQLTVHPVNDPPTLDALSNLVLARGMQPYLLDLTGIGTGASNETQVLNVTAQSSNMGIIPAPTVAYASPANSGVLTIDRRQTGSVSITVQVMDDGGTLDGGSNSRNRSFDLTVIQTPQLQIERDQEMLFITWPVEAADAVLESRPAVETGEWSPVAAEPEQVGAVWKVTLPVAGISQYFRLILP